MSEMFTSRVEAYAAPRQAEIVTRAGLDAAAGAMAAVGIGLGAGVLLAAAALSKLQEEVDRLVSEAETAVRFDASAAGDARARLRSELTGAESMLRALERADLGLLRAAAHAEDGQGLEQVRGEVHRLASQLGGPGTRGPDWIESLVDSARAARAEVEGVVSRAATRLVRAEGAVLAEAMRGTLEEMGYRVSAPRRPVRDAVVIKGQSDRGTSIHVRMEPQHGRVTADLSGFRGTACQQERQRFLEGLERRGVRVRLVERELHGRPDGGALTKQAEPLFTEAEGAGVRAGPCAGLETASGPGRTVSMASPAWLTRIEDARTCRTAGVILTMNTSDRMLLGEGGLEVASLQYALAHHFARSEYHVGVYSTGLGFRELVPPGVRRQRPAQSPFGDIPAGVVDPAVTLMALGRVLRRQDVRVLLIIDYADHIAPHTSGMTAMLSPGQMQTLQILHAWGSDDDIQATENFVVLVSHENSVTSMLTQGGGYRALALDLPDERTRAEFTAYLLKTRAAGYEDVLGELDGEMAFEEFGRVTGGLRLLEIEQLFRQAGARGVPVSREAVRAVKRRAISQICRDLVEVMEPERGFDAVAGAHHAKEFFELIRRPWLHGAASVPQAILLAGVPGCGKSHLVQALARELQCPLLVMRNVRDAWVGASERNLETVLWVAENLSPCILWTDEVDQAIGQRATGASGDSGTSERMLARTFEFFGSGVHRGKILWVATTNRPDLLDPALLDRFQVIIPFVHPTRNERAELLPLLSAQIGRTLAQDVVPEEVGSMPELDLLTVRSLQEILIKAGLRADDRRGDVGSPIAREHLEAAVRDYRPTYNPAEHEFLALKALEMTSFNSLLPWMGQDGVRPSAEWPRYLDPMVDRATGRLEQQALHARLGELQQLRLAERLQR